MSLKLFAVNHRFLFKTHLKTFNAIFRRNYENDSSDESSDKHFDQRIIKLYETHIPTTFIQKTVLSVGSAIAAINDPYRDGIISLDLAFIRLK